jgi:hypothetical protein
MLRFYAALDSATRNLKTVKHEVRVGNRVFQLRRQLRLGGPAFVLRHFRPFGHVEGPDDAPGLDEIRSAVRSGRRAIDEALAGAPAGVERARLEEVERRFAYGESMWEFLDALIAVSEAERVGELDAARAEFGRLARARDALASITGLTDAASEDSNAANGYEATEMVDLFERFRTRLEPPGPPTGK